MFVERSVEFNNTSLRFLEDLEHVKVEHRANTEDKGWLSRLLTMLNPFGQSRNVFKKNPYRIKKGF